MSSLDLLLMAHGFRGISVHSAGKVRSSSVAGGNLPLRWLSHVVTTGEQRVKSRSRGSYNLPGPPPHPRDLLPPAGIMYHRPHHFQKQTHQLGSKTSNTGVCGEQFHSHYNTSRCPTYFCGRSLTHLHTYPLVCNLFVHPEAYQ